MRLLDVDEVDFDLHFLVFLAAVPGSTARFLRRTSTAVSPSGMRMRMLWPLKLQLTASTESERGKRPDHRA